MRFDTGLTRVWREVRRWRSQSSDEPIQVDPELPPSDLRRLSGEIEAVIETRGGLAAARRRARRLALTYSTLSDTGRQRFFEHLAVEHDRDPERVDRAVERLLAAADQNRPSTGSGNRPDDDGPNTPSERRQAEAELRQALRPGHQTLLRRLAGQDGGLAFLVALRADLLPHRRSSPALGDLDAELHQILETWFDVGLLELVRLTWDTSAALLEKLIEYEAVHAIESWDDLKRRLGPGRRCYAFVHPGMPDDPLIFVEVALTRGVPDRLGPLLEPLGAEVDFDDRSGEDRADTAVFYSISNCHRGLAGVSLGDFLIKSVAEQLSAELNGLTTFATLSPLPGFRSWLERQIVDGPGGAAAAGPVSLAELHRDEGVDEADVMGQLRALIDGGARRADDPDLEPVRPVVEHLAARYVTTIRDDGRAIDPVAHFHLSNGARIERLNWMANPTPTGWDRGLGLMINYRYDLRTIEANHDRYVGTGELTMADDVGGLLEPRSGDGRRRFR
ncbi:MAG: malonyl-CoA decarboxylase family protein [Actinomycetota bacterium]